MQLKFRTLAGKVPDSGAAEVPVRAAAGEVPVTMLQELRFRTHAREFRTAAIPGILLLHIHPISLCDLCEVHFGVQLVGTRERAAAPVLVRWSRRGSKGRCRHALLAATCAVLAMATDAPIVRVDSGGDPSAPARSGEEFVTMTLPRRGVAGRADASKAWRRSI